MLATVKTAIALYDGVTAPLHSMNRAMHIVLNSFEAMQDASGHAVDTSAIQQAKQELAKAETAFDGIEQSIRDANQQQQRFNDSIERGCSSGMALLQKVKSIAVTLGGLASVKKIINLSDNITENTARLNLIVDDGGTVAQLEQKIFDSAQRSRALYMNTAAAIANMGANARAAFQGNDELIAFMEQVNKQFAVGGASAMLQLTQAMAAGTLRGEELNSILENAPGIARAIERYMGIAEGSIKSYAEQGAVTATVVKNALFAAADETNAKFESMPKTWGQIWNTMQNQALSIFSPILKRINSIANSEKFQTVFQGVINGLALIAEFATWVFDILISGVSWVIDNWSWLSPIIYGVAAAMAVYYGQLMLAKGAEFALAAAHGVVAVAKGIMAAGTMLLTGATWAQTTAQWGLNSALLACPLTWIIILIIALVAILYAAVAGVNKFAGTTISATGIICGMFMGALAFVGNQFIMFWNLIVDVFVLIYNLIGSVANFIGNVFIDPVGAVCRLFFDLADTVLGVLETLASAVDTIFGSNLAGAVQGWRSSLDGWVKDTFGEGEEFFVELDGSKMKLDRFSYQSAWDKGYSFGQGIDNKVAGLGDMFGGAGENFKGLLDGIYNNSNDTAANTAATANALDYTAEDLQYMKDIAEREAINRFTTAQIKVEQHNENHITKDVDVDGIMAVWANDFASKLDVSKEGS